MRYLSHITPILRHVWLPLLLVSAAPAFSFVDVGLGFSNVWVDSEANGVHGTSEHVSLAMGIGIANFSAQMLVGGGTDLQTGDILTYPPDKADYGVLAGGLRVSLWPLDTHLFTPWIEAGLCLASLVWKTYAYRTEGIGLELAGGLDLKLGSLPLILRVQFLWQDFEMTDSFGTDAGSVSGKVLSFFLVYRVAP